MTLVFVFTTVLGGLGLNVAEATSADNRIAGENRFETAAKIAEEAFEGKAEAVIIVRGDGAANAPNVVDGLTASVLAGAKDAPILLTNRNELPAATKAAITKLGAQKAYIVGGTVAVSPAVKEALEALGLTVDRVYGGNREETAVEVAKAAATGSKTAIIANSRALVDSLVAGPLAFANQYPILLVGQNAVGSATEQAIKDLGIENLIIVGGTGVVSPAVETALKGLVSGTVDRLSGNDRVGTSLAVAGKMGGNNVVLVNGWSFVDAVAASTLGLPILYVQQGQIHANVEALLATKTGFRAIGGPNAVSNTVVEAAIDAMRVKLEVLSVTAINSTGVTVRFAELSDAIESANLTVVSPNGKEIRTVARNLIKGATTATFAFETALERVTPGVWTVNGRTFTVSNTDASLSGLEVNGHSLFPAFDSEELDYKVYVQSNVTSVTVKPTSTQNGTTVIASIVGGNSWVVPAGQSRTFTLGNAGTMTEIRFEVIAPDNQTKEIYTIQVHRAAHHANDAVTLSNVTWEGNIFTSFSVNTRNYSALVGNTVRSTRVTTIFNGGVVLVNGVPVASNTPTESINLAVGRNEIIVTAISADHKTVVEYTFVITRVAPTGTAQSRLSSLTINPGILVPGFTAGSGDSENRTFNVHVPSNQANIQIQPSLVNPAAYIESVTRTINDGGETRDITDTNGVYTAALRAAGNTTQIVITTRSSNLSQTSTYTINVQRAATTSNDNAYLAELRLDGGANILASGSTVYNRNEANDKTSISVLAVKDHPNATVTVNGVAVDGINEARVINLGIGANKITIRVTAQDNSTTREYVINVNRASAFASNVRTLSALTVTNGTLSPVFASDTTSYTVNVGNAVTSMDLQATATNSNAVITALRGSNPVAVNNGRILLTNLAVGNTVVTITVTPENASAPETYVVTINRSAAHANDNVNLSALLLGGENIFAAGTTTYSRNVANGTSSITVVPTLVDTNARMTVNGVVVASGTSRTINLNIGVNTITIRVTAQDNVTTRDYIINVNRASSSASAETRLSNITVNAGQLSPQFDRDRSGLGDGNSYDVKVANSVTALNINTSTLHSQSNVRATFNGTNVDVQNGAIALTNMVEGYNTVIITVTAENGTATRQYEVRIQRAHAGASTNANLSALTVAATDVLQSGVTQYSHFVPNTTNNIVIVGTAVHAGATVTINGSTDTTVPLVIGNNVITVRVLAADNVTTKEYTVTVNRASGFASTETRLASMTVNVGQLTPAFNSNRTEPYTVSVGAGVDDMIFTVSAMDSNARISASVNGSATVSISGGVITVRNVPAGATALTITVTAQDNVTTRNIVVNITKAAP